MLEWRWPLDGRNTTLCGATGHTCDLHRQAELVGHYTVRVGLPTVVWDLDRHLDTADPLRRLANVAVCEFATQPSPGATTLLCPVPDDTLDAADPGALAALRRPVPLVYIGNQYDRDEAFDAFFAPAAALVEHRVAGKWTRVARWPWVNFTGRCAFADVQRIHGQALATVLLLPERYAMVGHITQRLFEAVLAGCLPIMPATVVDGQRFVPEALLAADGLQVTEKIDFLSMIAGSQEHADLIAACLRRLEPMRLSRQIAVLRHLLFALPSPKDK